jgi:hypothetical protein
MKMTRLYGVAALAALLPLGACDGLLQVDAPGNISDDDLNRRSAVAGLVVGMSRDLTVGLDRTLWFLAYGAGELFDSGSYGYGEFARGQWDEEDVDGFWARMQQPRWVAENGIQRMEEEIFADNPAAFANSPLVARAHFFAGITNRYLGENVCEAVFDGGPAEPFTNHFTRAESYFTRAIEIAGAAGATDLVHASYGGRASVRAWQGDWAGAVSDAQQVPVDFVYEAIFSTPSPSNDLQYETYSRYEHTVYNTEFENHPDDARAPWRIVYNADGSVATGANGTTPAYQQMKYQERDSDVPLVKGTEMLVLRAEAALRNDDIPGAYLLLNEAREFYGMTPLTPAATLDEAWATLRFERGATNWLEGRRLWDHRRWFAETGPAHDDFLAGDGEARKACVPISDEERRTNPNLG